MLNSGAWQDFARVHVLGRLPGMVMSRSVLHLPDTSWLLRGVAMVPAPSRDSFWLWVFVQPLYVPADRLVLRYGQLLARMSDRNLTGWPGSLTPELGTEIATSVRTQALPQLNAVQKPSDLLTVMQPQREELPDPAHLEAAVYSAVLTGDTSAVQFLGQQMRELSRNGHVGGAEGRMRRVLAAYDEGGATGTVDLLRRWRDETAHRLQLN